MPRLCVGGVTVHAQNGFRSTGSLALGRELGEFRLQFRETLHCAVMNGTWAAEQGTTRATSACNYYNQHHAGVQRDTEPAPPCGPSNTHSPTGVVMPWYFSPCRRALPLNASVSRMFGRRQAGPVGRLVT